MFENIKKKKKKKGKEKKKKKATRRPKEQPSFKYGDFQPLRAGYS